MDGDACDLMDRAERKFRKELERCLLNSLLLGVDFLSVLADEIKRTNVKRKVILAHYSGVKNKNSRYWIMLLI